MTQVKMKSATLLLLQLIAFNVIAHSFEKVKKVGFYKSSNFVDKALLPNIYYISKVSVTNMPITDYSQKINLKENNQEKKHKGTIEFGGGLTAHFIKTKWNSYQFNMRGLLNVSNENNTLIGINVNYSNQSLISGNQRIAAHFVCQLTMINDGKDMLYFTAMAGAGFYPKKAELFEDAEYDYLFSMHSGLTYKHFIKNSKGFFVETGIGGPYFLNTGLFFS